MKVSETSLSIFYTITLRGSKKNLWRFDKTAGIRV